MAERLPIYHRMKARRLLREILPDEVAEPPAPKPVPKPAPRPKAAKPKHRAASPGHGPGGGPECRRPAKPRPRLGGVGDEDVYREGEAAAILDVTPAELEEMRAARTGPTVERLGDDGPVQYRGRALKAWVKRQRRGAAVRRSPAQGRVRHPEAPAPRAPKTATRREQLYAQAEALFRDPRDG